MRKLNDIIKDVEKTKVKLAAAEKSVDEFFSIYKATIKFMGEVLEQKTSQARKIKIALDVFKSIDEGTNNIEELIKNLDIFKGEIVDEVDKLRKEINQLKALNNKGMVEVISTSNSSEEQIINPIEVVKEDTVNE